MAEGTAFTKCWWTFPGGGGNSGRSNTELPIASLGTKVRGVDTNGYVGEWVYVVAGEAITANMVVTPKDTTTSGPTTTTFYTVYSGGSGSSSNSAAKQGVAGVAEVAFTSGYYGWIRTRGYATITTDSVSAVANETMFASPDSGTLGTALVYAEDGTAMPFATVVKDTTTATTNYVNLHCYVY